MQLLFTSPSLTAPTIETLHEYGTRRFTKLSRYLPTFEGEYSMRVSVRRERYLFVITLEIGIPRKVIVKTSDEDLRKAIDEAYDIMRRTLLRKISKNYGH